MGWDTELDPKKLPKIESAFDPPVLSMDDYIRFCARMRMRDIKHLSPSQDLRDKNFPVDTLFKL